MLCRGVRLARLLALYVIASMLLVDGYSHLLPVGLTGDKVLLAVDGVECSCPCCRVVRHIGVDGLRRLGWSSVETLIVVGHGFGSGGSWGLEVGEWTALLLHPLLVLVGALELGVADGGYYAAATWRIALFTAPLTGKNIVVVACGDEGVGEFARAFAELGANVAVLKAHPSRVEASLVCTAVARLVCTQGFNATALRLLGFDYRPAKPASLAPVAIGVALFAVHTALTVRTVMVLSRCLYKRRPLRPRRV